MLFTALIFGLLGSFHCVGMCGPIAFMLPVSQNNPIKKFIQVCLYHLGRLLAYASIGLVFGLAGKSFNLFGIQQQLSIAVGILMIAAIVLPFARLTQNVITTPVYRIIGRIKSSLGKALKKKSPDTFLTIGVLNGFLPCGLVYMAVFGALASGGILNGSLYMILFGAGTIPLMTLAVYSRNILGAVARKNIQKLIPVFVIVIGFLFILRGMGLNIPYVSPAPVTQLSEAPASCH